MRESKKKVFGLLVIIPPCLELSHILDWLEDGNYHELTASDWLDLERLATRCDDPELIERVKNALIRGKKAR